MELKVNYSRYQEFIRSLEEREDQTGAVLLYGSSFFTHWGCGRAKNQLAEATQGRLSVVNHGFGGAVVDELLYFYPRLVLPAAPRAVVIRAGFNEICGGQTPRDAVFLLKRLVDWIHADFPGIPVILLKIFHCKLGDQALHDTFAQYNRHLEQVFAEAADVQVWDINPFFYNDSQEIGDRTKLRDVFISDGLNLNDTGYEEMAVYLGGRLDKALHQA